MLKKEKIKDLRYAVSGVLGAAEVATKSDELIGRMGAKAKIPGFRAGHVPTDVLRRRFGNDATENAINDLINADLDTFIKEKKIRIAGRPNANLPKFVPGEDIEYSLEFDILPVLPKIDLEKIVLHEKTPAVGDSDVEAALENIKKTHSNFQKENSDYKLAAGDIAVIDFVGYVGDEAFEGGAGRNHHLTLGAGQFIPGFEDQVIGHKTGDEFDVFVRFPEKYHSEKLAGKDARFAVKVIEARHPIPPAADDELAKQVGMNSIAEVRGHIKKVLADQAAESAKAEMRNELLDILADKVKLDVPETLVEQELTAGGGSPQPKVSSEQKTAGKAEKEERADATRRVKLGLILAEWGNQNGISVTRDELQRAIWAEAARYPNPEEIYDFYNKNQSALSMTNGMLFERKTLDAMIEKCGKK